MDNVDPALLLERLGLSSEALGPPEEWAPTNRRNHQVRHAQFWNLVTGIVPEDEKDEEFWMTPDASDQLRENI